MSSSSSSINSEQDHEKDIYDDDMKVLRQKGSTSALIPNGTERSGSGGYDFRYIKMHNKIIIKRKHFSKQNFKFI